MDKMKILIVDDEPLARQIIVKYLEDQPDVEVVGECENGFEAIKAISDLKPDLLLLDIQMPKIDGFELLEVIDPKPAIIFATAYDQFAIKAFEMNAVDYLLKPFPKDRLIQAVERVRAQLKAGSDDQKEKIFRIQEQVSEAEQSIDRVICRVGSKLHVIPVEKIQYVESQDDYVMVYSEIGNYLKEKTMKYFESHLPSQVFLRVHRSYIVNLSQITSIEPYGKDTHLALLKNGARLKVSAEGYKRLRERL